MKISGSQRLPIPPEEAYRIMQDPEILARAIPGCESLEKIGEDEYKMKMKMALASISGSFEGKVRITDQTPPTSFRLIVEGAGKIGFVKGDGLLNLSPADGGTEVTYEGDAQVGGTMAAVGQRLIDGTSKMMIKKFFEKLVSV
ncbi:MAG TPA: carbon monoxide dehydrogenase subunit G [Bryobacteraceae bacterium]|nr:carbon monoxide dehydrogenase subunit G [Bryobacteraceae bacterium]